MNKKAADQSAQLRKKLEDIHSKKEKRFRVRKSKIQKLNENKLKVFQQKLVTIDQDPKSPMTRRINPGNFIHSPVGSDERSRNVS